MVVVVWIIIACFGAIVVGVSCYLLGSMIGYSIGYTEGLEYGTKGLHDYHEYTMKNLRSLGK